MGVSHDLLSIHTHVGVCVRAGTCVYIYIYKKRHCVGNWQESSVYGPLYFRQENSVNYAVGPMSVTECLVDDEASHFNSQKKL